MPASQQSFTQWQMTTPYGVEGVGNDVTVMHGPTPFFRDGLDFLRSGARTPEANYPDGYLGTIQTRRGDRLLENLQRRQNERSYTRGVHKGERIDQSDYFWPDDFDIGSPIDGDPPLGAHPHPIHAHSPSTSLTQGSCPSPP